jgi:hypothetical protein
MPTPALRARALARGAAAAALARTRVSQRAVPADLGSALAARLPDQMERAALSEGPGRPTAADFSNDHCTGCVGGFGCGPAPVCPIGSDSCWFTIKGYGSRCTNGRCESYEIPGDGGRGIPSGP